MGIAYHESQFWLLAGLSVCILLVEALPLSWGCADEESCCFSFTVLIYSACLILNFGPMGYMLYASNNVRSSSLSTESSGYHAAAISMFVFIITISTWFTFLIINRAALVIIGAPMILLSAVMQSLLLITAVVSGCCCQTEEESPATDPEGATTGPAINLDRKSVKMVAFI
jgi:hypothetical protein